MSPESAVGGQGSDARLESGPTSGVDEDSLSIRYTLTEQDLYDQFRQNLATEPDIRNIIWGGYAVLLLGIYVAFALFLPRLQLVLLVGAVALAAHLLYRWVLRLQIRKIIRRDVSSLANVAFTLSPTGVHLIFNADESAVEWSGVARIEALYNQLRFTFSPEQSLLIPRRAFASPTQADTFLETAQNWHSTYQATLLSEMASDAASNAFALHFMLTDEDLYQFARRHRGNEWIYNARLIASVVVAGVVALSIAKLPLFPLLLLFLIAAPLAIPLDRWILRVKVADQIRKAPNRVGHALVTLSPDGVLSGTTLYPWKAIQRIEEADVYTSLYIGPSEAVLIPHRAFASSEVAERFQTAARSWYAEARYPGGLIRGTPPG